jgi:tight adherence protein B
VTRLPLWLAAAAVALAAAAAPAGAAGRALAIAEVDTSRFPTVAVTVEARGGEVPALEVRENGQPAAGVRAGDGAATSIALLIDTSRSMRGERLRDAVRAARGFVRRQPPGTLVAVYGFGAAPRAAAPYAVDRTAATAALGGLAVGAEPGTAIYGAVALAARDAAAVDAGRRIAIVLSDGASLDDSATLSQAIAGASSAGLAVYPVAFGASVPSAALSRLAAETGGRAAAAGDARALQATYRSLAGDLGGRRVLVYRSLVPAGAPLRLEVEAEGLPTAAAGLRAPGAPPATGGGEGDATRLPTGPVARAALAAGAALLVALAVLALLSARAPKTVAGRIAPFVTARSSDEAGPGDAPRRSALEQLYLATERVAGRMNFWRKATARLEQADLPLRTAELLYIQVAAAIVVGGLAVIALGQRGPGAIAALAIGFALPSLVVRLKARRRLAAFEAQLPETLITLAASLKAGHGLTQAMQVAVQEGIDPTAKEFGRVLAEVQLGMAPDAALEAMAKRTRSANFGFVVVAVNIQRTVGGSMADLLDMVADTVRQRQQFSRKVKALTAQGRMSAYVLLALPFGMGGIIFLINADFMRPLFTTGAGKAMIATALVLMGIGAACCRKIVNFRV